MSEPRFSAVALLFCAPFLAAGLSACGSSTDEPEGPPTGQKTSTFCASSENTAPDFAMPMVEMGAAQKFEVTITEATPTVPVEGKNSWVVKVTDASGAAVEDAVVSIRCSMPGHTHGCAVVPDITNKGDGLYEVSPIVFNMSKNWNVSFTVKSADGASTDSATFGVCI